MLLCLPLSLSVARRRTDATTSRPWKSEVKIEGRRYYLGYFATKEEAVADEREFRMSMTGKPESGHVNCLCHYRRDGVW
jgi:hypothetical protein